MLADICLEEVKKAFDSDPEIGFVYSNCSSFFENGTFQQFRIHSGRTDIVGQCTTESAGLKP
jgi:hypothetical protein